MPAKTIGWCLPRPSLSKYPGSFPRFFERKLIKLFGFPETLSELEIFHPFGGRAEFGIRNDINRETDPDLICDAHDLKVIRDEAFKFVIVDPHYT